MHFFLQIHRDSGVWILHANQSIKLNGFEILKRESHSLYQEETHLTIGDFHFLIQFMIKTPGQEKGYLDLRNPKMTQRFRDSPHSLLSGIPFESDFRLPTVAFRHGLGFGKYGKVFEGFDPKTGEFRAVKVLEITDEYQRDAAKSEIRALQHCQKFQNVVKLYGVHNQLGGVEAEGNVPMYVYLVMAKGQTIESLRWETETLPKHLTVRLHTCFNFLCALRDIHAEGHMHRDLTPQNLLHVWDYNAPGQITVSNVAICDFGKYCWLWSSQQALSTTRSGRW